MRVDSTKNKGSLLRERERKKGQKKRKEKKERERVCGECPGLGLQCHPQQSDCLKR